MIDYMFQAALVSTIVKVTKEFRDRFEITQKMFSITVGFAPVGISLDPRATKLCPRPRGFQASGRGRARGETCGAPCAFSSARDHRALSGWVWSFLPCCFGPLTPEKRMTSALQAIGARVVTVVGTVGP